MLRRLALALSLSTALITAGSGVAQAGPAIAAIGAFAATPLGGIVVNAAVGLVTYGASALLNNLVNPDADRPGSRAVSGYVSSPTDPAGPISFNMGTRAIAGTIAYRGVWGSAGKVQNAYYVEERVLADVPLADDPGPAAIVLEKVRYEIDWDAVPTAQGYPIPGLNLDGKDYGWARWHDGSQTTADTYLRSKFGSHPDQPYTAGMVGRGQAKLILTLRVNDKLFKGFPEWKTETVGIAMYNIAKDTTVGGSGSHRIDNPATWEPSDLLPVHIFNGLLGVRFGDEWVWGGQSTAASQLPAANWIAAIAEANTTVDRVGGTEKQYIGGMEIAGDMEPASVFEHQLRACSGRFAEIGGIYKMICGLPASPVMSFTDANIVVSKAQGFEPFPRPEATFNAILSKYREPSSGWQLKEAPEIRNADWIDEDGGYRPANIAYEAVSSGTQVQRLNFEAMADSRRWRTHAMGLGPEASELEPLDMVAWSSDRRGYDAKSFLIDEMSDEETFEQFVTLREVDPADHGSYDPDDNEQAMVFPTLDLAAPTPVVMAGYQVFADTITGDNGAARPTVRLRIPAGLDDVQFIRVSVRRDSDQSQAWTGTLPYTQGLADGSSYDVKLGAVLLQLTAYEVEAVEIPFSTRAVVSSGWLDVTTGNVPLGPPDVYGLTLETLADEVKGTLRAFGETTRALLEQAQEWATVGAGEALANYAEHSEIRREVQVTKEDVTARYVEAINAAAGPGSALVVRVESLEATVNNPSTGVSATSTALSLLTTRTTTAEGNISTNASDIDALESTVNNPLTGVAATAAAATVLDTRVDGHDNDLAAQANAITSVSAGTTPGNVTTATSRMSVITGVAGYAVVGWELKNSTWRTASILMRAPNNPLLPTEIIMDAQAFYLGDFSSGSAINPLIFSGGSWRMNVANIGTVTAGTIQSASGASYWNLATGDFRIAV